MESARVSTPPGAATASSGAARSAANGRAPAADTDPSQAGGFLALLAALGGAEQDALAPAVPAMNDAGVVPGEAQADPAAAGTAQDAASLAAWQGLLGAGAEVRQGLPGAPDESRLTSQASPWAAGLSGGQPETPTLAGAASALGQGVPGGAGDGPLQGLVAETMLMDSTAGLAPGAQPAGAAGRMLARLQALRADGAAPGGPARLAGSAGEGSAMPLQGATGAAPNVAAWAGELPARGLPADAALHGGRSAAAPGQRAEGDTPPAGSDMAAALLPVGAAARGAGAGGAGPSGGAFEGASPASAHADATPLDGATPAADPAYAAAADEQQVAEQVAYWVHQKTQNAELTLNRDGRPVEVSVSLSGNEAHVSFRSDEAHTRELLDRSMAQLSELLRSEGLVLSGMSVGSPAGQGRGSAEQQQQQRQRGDARQAQVAAVAPAGSAAGAVRSGGITERSVDIFV